MTRSRTAARVFALAAALLFTAGCKTKPPGPGESCEPKEVRCQDTRTELACESGTLIAAPCKGPEGCKQTDDRIACDFSGNADGDRCSKGDEGASKCTPDGKSRIECRGGKYRIEPCRGDDGCKSKGASVRCDQSLARVDDPCTTGTACDLGGTKVLKCKDGKFQLEAECPGEGGCKVGSTGLDCDLGKKKAKSGD